MATSCIHPAARLNNSLATPLPVLRAFENARTKNSDEKITLTCGSAAGYTYPAGDARRSFPPLHRPQANTTKLQGISRPQHRRPPQIERARTRYPWSWLRTLVEDVVGGAQKRRRLL